MNGARNETLSAIESISDASTQTAECSSSVHLAAGTQMVAVKNLDVASQSLTAKAESLLDALATFTV
jgi:methyl-accepting chemotaxis protein